MRRGGQLTQMNSSLASSLCLWLPPPLLRWSGSLADYCDGVRSACLGAGRQVRIPVAIAHNQTHKPGARRLRAQKRAEVSIRWRNFFRVYCSVWVTLVCSVVSSESALIGSSSPVPRSSPSRNYILFSPPSRFFSCFGQASLLAIDRTHPLLPLFTTHQSS